MSRKKLLALALAVGATPLAGCAGGENGDAASPAAAEAQAEPMTIELKEENGSGQTGTATLEPNGDTFDVTIEMTPPQKFEGEYQRAHVHDITCAEYRQAPDPEAQLQTAIDELNDLDGGTSSSTVYAPLSARSGSFSINVHEQNDPFTVVACADIPKQDG